MISEKELVEAKRALETLCLTGEVRYPAGHEVVLRGKLPPMTSYVPHRRSHPIDPMNRRRPHDRMLTRKRRSALVSRPRKSSTPSATGSAGCWRADATAASSPSTSWKIASASA
jgi:hypothetical protein